MSASLKKRCEKAIAAEMKKRPIFRLMRPVPFDSDEKKTLAQPAIQASPQGEEAEGFYGYGVYPVDCLVTFKGLPRKGMEIDDYISEVDDMFAEWNAMTDAQCHQFFLPYDVLLMAVIPRQVPASIEGRNRVNVTGIQLLARKVARGTVFPVQI